MRGWLLAVVLLTALNAAADCRPSTNGLESMADGKLLLKGPGDRSVPLAVRVADDHRERAAGFQYICPATIDGTAIYFVFERPRRPSFHMRNVKAPLDIAFIDERGVIVDIQRMEPYVLGAKHYTYYGPPDEVVAALEARAGYFSGQGIAAGDWTIEVLHQ